MGSLAKLVRVRGRAPPLVVRSFQGASGRPGPSLLARPDARIAVPAYRRARTRSRHDGALGFAR